MTAEREAGPIVAAVIVTHDRAALLVEAVQALQAQTRPAQFVIVVDNCSADGTRQLVRDRFGPIDLVALTKNVGGAGGFAAGMSQALVRGAELVWLLDDDAVPAPDALRALLAARQSYSGLRPAIVASKVVWTDGRTHPMNTPRRRLFATKEARLAAARIECVPIRSASFVSILVDAAACRRAGLPQADYFMWNDDFEFTARVLRHDVGLLCSQSVVVHKTRYFGSTDVDPGHKFFYEVRNKIWTFRSRAPLAPIERLIYVGSTLRRWVRTFALSQNRPTLWRALLSGLQAGALTRPRPTHAVLSTAGWPPVSPDYTASRRTSPTSLETARGFRKPGVPGCD